MTPGEWFALLFGDAPSGAWIAVSYKRDSATRHTKEDPFLTEWFRVSEIGNAGAFAAEKSASHNVYMGMGLRRQNLGPSSRGVSRDVCAIPGLWVELDVADEIHADSAKAYFPDKASALCFLNGLPLRPSIIIDSGHGVHAHWLFREPFLIEEETDYRLASGLEHGWQVFLCGRTGYGIDSTFDLARVLRPPGTLNRKKGTVSQVQVVSQSGLRYNPDDFATWVEIGDPSAPRHIAHGLVLNPKAEPPGMKFYTLVQNDKRFKGHWDEKPINPKDNSSSAHALGLATIAGRAGWSDQEITDLLVAFLAKSKTSHTKPRPLGWYAITIDTARRGQEQATEQTKQVERASEATEPEERTAALSALLGFKIVRIVRRFHQDDATRTTMEPWYIIETEDSRVPIENPDILASFPRFRTRILGHLNICIDVSPKNWPKVVTAIAKAAITEDAPPESNPCEDYRQAVREYMERRTVTRDPVSAHDMSHVYDHDGKYWFSASKWAEWARMKRGMELGPRNLTRILELAGCRRKVLRNIARPNGKLTKLTFWTLAEEGSERVQ